MITDFSLRNDGLIIYIFRHRHYVFEQGVQEQFRVAPQDFLIVQGGGEYWQYLSRGQHSNIRK